MAAIPARKQTPILEYSLEVGEQPLLVRSTKKDESYREFQLIRSGNVKSTAVLAIESIGVCIQSWFCRNFNVKMFTISKNAGIYSNYFIAVDVEHEEIAAYSENLTRDAWRSRFSEEDPNLTRHITLRLFGKKYLPDWIGWEKSSPQGCPTWGKTYENSEVGLLRIGKPDDAEGVCSERVLYATYASNTRGEDWKKIQIVERKALEPERPVVFLGRIINEDAHVTNVNVAELSPEKHHAYEGSSSLIGCFLGTERGTGRPILSPYVDLELACPNFMPQVNLATESTFAIETYVRDTVLKDVPYKDGFIKVTRQMHQFRSSPMYPAICVSLSPHKTSLGQFLGFIEKFIPRLTEQRIEAEQVVLSTRILEKPIEEGVANPDLSVVTQEAYKQVMTQAHASGVPIEIFIATNRKAIHVPSLDQSLPLGYRIRSWLTGGQTERKASDQPTAAPVV